MKKCNRIIEKETIELNPRTIKVVHKNLHGNCQYAGLWEKDKNLITIDTFLSECKDCSRIAKCRLLSKKISTTKNHEYLHAALCTFVESLDSEKDAEQVEALCSICNALESNTKLRCDLRKYGVG